MFPQFKAYREVDVIFLYDEVNFSCEETKPTDGNSQEPITALTAGILGMILGFQKSFVALF